MSALTPTSELEAINLMLSTVGESPIESLLDGSSVDASQAKLFLKSVSRQVQQRGWWFNSEENYPLNPDLQSKNIKVPPNTIEITSDDTNLVLRGTRLYDKGNHTYRFDKAVTVDIVFLLPFEELPEPARLMITHRAGRMFQERVFGSDTLSTFNKQDEFAANQDLVAADIAARNPSMLKDSTFAQNLLRRS